MRALLRFESTPARWSQMFLCGIATVLPLLVGLYTGDILISIYGALTGYLLTLNDHMGTLFHRLWVLTLTFAILVAGFTLGLYLQNHETALFVTIAVLAYWIGLLGGEGAQLERALLFSAIQILVAVNSKNVSIETAPQLFLYASTGYTFVMLATLAHGMLSKKPPEVFMSLLAALKRPLASREERHLHALSYTIIALLAMLLVEHWNIERGYWAVITMLIVMKPDRTQSLHRSFQRLVGTALGVLVCEALIFMIRTPEPIIFVIFVCSIFVPWANKRNYWVMSLLVSVIVILMLDLAAVERGDFHTPLLRLWATMIGCGLGGMGSLVSRGLSVLIHSMDKAPNNPG